MFGTSQQSQHTRRTMTMPRYRKQLTRTCRQPEARSREINLTLHSPYVGATSIRAALAVRATKVRKNTGDQSGVRSL